MKRPGSMPPPSVWGGCAATIVFSWSLFAMSGRPTPAQQIQAASAQPVRVASKGLSILPLALPSVPQIGPKLVGAGAVGIAGQGSSMAISADGNTAIVGGAFDRGGHAAAWIWVRGSGGWTQQGPKLVATDAAGGPERGSSVSISGNGRMAALGWVGDGYGAGAVWIWKWNAGTWVQDGPKLTGSGGVGLSSQAHRYHSPRTATHLRLADPLTAGTPEQCGYGLGAVQHGSSRARSWWVQAT
jgi:hypothetical protein